MGDPPITKFVMGGSPIHQRIGIAPLGDMNHGAPVTPQPAVWPQGQPPPVVAVQIAMHEHGRSRSEEAEQSASHLIPGTLSAARVPRDLPGGGPMDQSEG